MSRKFTPDQKLIFDSDSSNLRWFLLPSEAKQYILGEKVEIKSPVFSIRGSNFQCTPLLHSSNENDFSKTCIEKQDVNCNFQGDNISRIKNENNIACNLSCFASKGNIYSDTNIVMDTPKCKWHSPPTIIFKPFLKVSKIDFLVIGNVFLFLYDKMNKIHINS